MSTQNKLVIATNNPNPIKADFIRLLHNAALHNQLGYMDGMDPDTGDEVPLLVGVEYDDEGNPKQLWPLAIAFIDGSKLKNYLAPDGNGSYYNQTLASDAAGEPIDTDIGGGIELPDEPAEEQGRPTVKSANSRKGRRRKVGADDDRDVSGGSV